LVFFDRIKAMRTLRSALVIVSMRYVVGLAFFLLLARLRLISFAMTDSFETVNIWRTALSSRSHGVFPATSGAGFIVPP
jgi:hypothetical protein